MSKGKILPIAIMAFSLVAVLFVLDYSINSSLKWPWSTNSIKKITSDVFANINKNTTVSDTATWLTYKNTNLGYTIKYPGNWNFTENYGSPDITLLNPKSEESNISGIPHAVLINRLDVSEAQQEIGKLQNITTSQVNGLSVTHGDLLGTYSHQKYNVIVKGNYGYIVSWTLAQDSQFYSSMLSTFIVTTATN